MPQLDKNTWGIAFWILLFFGILWIFFLYYTRAQTKVVFLFFSFLAFQKQFTQAFNSGVFSFFFTEGFDFFLVQYTEMMEYVLLHKIIKTSY
jgi:hypothetical protein